MPYSRPSFPHKILELLSRPPGYKKLLHVFGRRIQGEHLLKLEWDICIILDECRFDLFESVLEDDWTPPHQELAKFDRIISVDSATKPWIQKTFNGPEGPSHSPITYVTANPYSVEVRGSPTIEQLDEVWKYAWDPKIGTVPPRAVADRTIHHYQNGEKRLMAHFLQPHGPFLRRTDQGLVTHPDVDYSLTSSKSSNNASEFRSVSTANRLNNFLPGSWDWPAPDSGSVYDRLRTGELAHQTVWNAYRESLLLVLEEITKLLQSVDAERVVITSDHGNAFGEWGIYGHPIHNPFSVLRKVPYLVTTAKKSMEYAPESYEIDTEETHMEKLRDLGYLDEY